MITVYTVITGGKDGMREMPEIREKSEAKFVAFLSNEMSSVTWNTRPAYDRFVDPRRNSRIQKILAHQYIDTEYSIYIDGNITLLTTPEELVKKYLGDYDIAVFTHPNRDCIYAEAIQCAKRGLDNAETIIEQAKMYEDSGYAKHKGLCECGIILRRHTPQVAALNNAWWSEFCRHSKRDQISFMYAVDRVGIPVNMVNIPFMASNRVIDGQLCQIGIRDGDFEIIPHKKWS